MAPSSPQRHKKYPNKNNCLNIILNNLGKSSENSLNLYLHEIFVFFFWILANLSKNILKFLLKEKSGRNFKFTKMIWFTLLKFCKLQTKSKTLSGRNVMLLKLSTFYLDFTIPACVRTWFLDLVDQVWFLIICLICLW